MGTLCPVQVAKGDRAHFCALRIACLLEMCLPSFGNQEPLKYAHLVRSPLHELASFRVTTCVVFGIISRAQIGLKSSALTRVLCEHLQHVTKCVQPYLACLRIRDTPLPQACQIHLRRVLMMYTQQFQPHQSFGA